MSKEITILMPCLNEEKTLKTCIDKAKTFLSNNGIDGEILIADNGSKDNSIEIAKECGARVIHVKEKGYGHALIEGMNAAEGKYIIMGDSDDSYDFLHLEKFVEKLREGYDLVIGNRFEGGIEKGAMSFSHRYIGNPVLSFIGRLFYKSNIKDFHCGLRGYNKEKIESLDLSCGGMEYASEMIVKAELKKLKITQVATTLKKDGRGTKSHLKTFRDGFRHLIFLFLNAPNWLFFIPGMFLIIIGLLGTIILSNGQFHIDNYHTLSINSMLYCTSSVIIGFQLIIFYIFYKLYAFKVSLIVEYDALTKYIIKHGVLKWIVIGLLFMIIGFTISLMGVLEWKELGFGDLNPSSFMPNIIIANALMVLGIEMFFSAILIHVMSIKVN